MFGIQSLTVWVHHGEPQREQHKHDRVSDKNKVTSNHNSKASLAPTGSTLAQVRPAPSSCLQTRLRLLTRVGPHVAGQVGLLGAGVVAVGALERSDA